jgi:hypothetical protein
MLMLSAAVTAWVLPETLLAWFDARKTAMGATSTWIIGTPSRDFFARPSRAVCSSFLPSSVGRAPAASIARAKGAS